MPNISGRMAARMLARGIRNKIQNKPLSVSFEITQGWVKWWNGPMIEITHPEQIEVLPR